MEVEVDEDEDEAAAAEVDEDDEVAWASLGGVGCCGGCCCGGGGCGGDWATPEPRWPLPPPAPPGPPPGPPRSAMARPGAGRRGGYGDRGDGRKDRPGFSRGGRGGSIRLLSPPARARERELHARAGPRGARSSRSPAAACCGSRRRDTGWACPGRGRGAPARARPTQRPGAGPRSGARPGRACGRARPSLLGGGGRRLGALRLVLSSNSRPGGSPLNLAAHFSPLSFSAVAAEPSGNSAFPGRGPGPERAAAGARLGPLRSVDLRPDPPHAQTRFPTADLAPALRPRGASSPRPAKGAMGTQWSTGRRWARQFPPLLPSVGRGSDLESKKPLARVNSKAKPLFSDHDVPLLKNQ